MQVVSGRVAIHCARDRRPRATVATSATLPHSYLTNPLDLKPAIYISTLLHGHFCDGEGSMPQPTKSGSYSNSAYGTPSRRTTHPMRFPQRMTSADSITSRPPISRSPCGTAFVRASAASCLLPVQADQAQSPARVRQTHWSAPRLGKPRQRPTGAVPVPPFLSVRLCALKAQPFARVPLASSAGSADVRLSGRRVRPESHRQYRLRQT